MAQITIPDEQYKSLVALANERGVSPGQLVASLIEEYERNEQLAFWGESTVENVRRQMEETEHPTHYMSEEQFFAELDAVDATPDKSRDADV